MTKKTCFGKGIVLGMIFLFVSIGVSPCVAETQKGRTPQAFHFISQG